MDVRHPKASQDYKSCALPGEKRAKERMRGIGPTIGWNGPKILEFPESPARRTQERCFDEGKLLLRDLPPNYKLVLLEEVGKELSSKEFSSLLHRWHEEATAGVRFIIGGADGIEESLRRKATISISFGRMTIPHQIVRVLLVEQIYRAATIIMGHPYHRD